MNKMIARLWQQKLILICILVSLCFALFANKSLSYRRFSLNTQTFRVTEETGYEIDWLGVQLKRSRYDSDLKTSARLREITGEQNTAHHAPIVRIADTSGFFASYLPARNIIQLLDSEKFAATLETRPELAKQMLPVIVLLLRMHYLQLASDFAYDLVALDSNKSTDIRERIQDFFACHEQYRLSYEADSQTLRLHLKLYQ